MRKPALQRLPFYVCPILAVLVLAGCVPNRAWRVKYVPNLPPVIDPPTPMTVSSTGCHGQTGEASYWLTFIEFDDRGEFFERGQLEQALEKIRNVKETATADDPATVVVFVHGWKNNASERAGNVAGFKSMMGCFANQFNKHPGIGNSRVVGIYIGWRGDVLDVPLIRELTYWDRRDESRNLPGAHTTETLLSIMKAIKGRDYTDRRGQSLLIGHSFGGSLLEEALTQTYENIVLNTASGQPIKWPTDLTVLINEAAPSSQSYQLVESLEANIQLRPACGPDRERAGAYLPAIISFTSVGDTGTGFFFPLGQAFSRPFNSLRRYPHPNAIGARNQTEMYLRTTGHESGFFSHVVAPKGSPTVMAARRAGCMDALDSFGLHNPPNPSANYSLVELPGARNRSPYWVTQLPTAIVPDHSTIFGNAFRDLMIDLVLGQYTPGGEVYRRK